MLNQVGIRGFGRGKKRTPEESNLCTFRLKKCVAHRLGHSVGHSFQYHFKIGSSPYNAKNKLKKGRF